MSTLSPFDCTGTLTRLDGDYIQIDSMHGFWLSPWTKLDDDGVNVIHVGDTVHVRYDIKTMTVISIEKKN